MKKKMALVEREPYLFNHVNFEAMSSLFGKRLKADVQKTHTRDQIGTKYHYYFTVTIIMGTSQNHGLCKKVISPKIKHNPDWKTLNTRCLQQQHPN